MKFLKLYTKVFFAILLLNIFAVSANAAQISYQYDDEGKSISAPNSYILNDVWYSQDNGTTAMKSPTDLYVDKDGNIYISDTGNSRVLVLNKRFEILFEISKVYLEGKEQYLSAPEGVFVGNDGLIYICDTGNKRVIAVDNFANIKRQILGKDMLAVEEVYEFKPERVAVDSFRNVYVISNAVYQGVIRFSADDTFSSFYAPNTVKETLNTWLLSFWKSWFTDEQKDAMEKALPDPNNNLYIDADDFIYTTSDLASDANMLRKNNLKGDNILKSASSIAEDVKFGDLEKANWSKTSLVDVHVDEQGIISVIDASTNRIFQYTQEGDLIAIFGGNGDLKGQFSNLTALEKSEDYYIALDKDKASLTIFSPTDYIRNVRQALKLYNTGLYTDAEDLWKDILDKNENLTLAYRGIGRAALQNSDYKRAMQYLEKGNDNYYYSLAFKEYRKIFVREYALLLVIGVAIIITGVCFAIKYLRRYLLSGGKNNVKH